MSVSPSRPAGVPAEPGPPRTPLLRPAELSDEQAALHAAIARGPRAGQAAVPLTDDEDRLLGPFALMLLAPAVGDAVQRVGAALRTRTALSSRSRELAILTVAAHHRSRFEWLAHEQAARQLGLDETQLRRLLDGQQPSGLDEREACAVRTVRELLDRGTLDDAGYAAALTILGERQLAELVWLVGYYGMLALALATLRPAPE